jgi:NAD(P)H-flavin reductase
MLNSLQPIPAILERIVPMVPNNHVFTFLPEVPMSVAPGQFVEISLPGVGGFPVSACDLVRETRIASCIRKTGRVTAALYRLEVGARVGLRGPFGNGFDLESLRSRDVLMVAGGLGMAPLRALLFALLEKEWPHRLVVLYGSRCRSALLFHDELVRLAGADRIELRFSVDFDDATPPPPGDVPCRTGLVNELLDDLELDAASTAAVVSGPPALYHCVLEDLATLGLPPELVFATLERRMRCGIGECCHCVTAGVFICQEGPVFSLAQLRNMEGAV